MNETSTTSSPLSFSSSHLSSCKSASSGNDISCNNNNNNNNSNSSSSTNIYVNFNFNEHLNFKEILALFNCAISQEQAWAVLYQCLIELRRLLDADANTVRLNQDKIDMSSLYFTKDGSVLVHFTRLLSSSQHNNNNKNVREASSPSSAYASYSEHERVALETKVLKSIAYLIYDALDYGNSCGREPELESSLFTLLLLISGHYKEYSKNRFLSEDDEGYDPDEEDSISIDKAIDTCKNNVAEAEYHYRAVCRGLYAQAYELKAFLAKIEDSKSIIHRSGKDTTHYCFEVLNKTDWAKLWMQVISELRIGVKLRKVREEEELCDPSQQQQDHQHQSSSSSSSSVVKFKAREATASSGQQRRHVEYELTPFEILLDQIRTRRYHLKKTEHPIGAELKKDARDIILEFIRSRPPLKSVSLRCLGRSKASMNTCESLSMHERLMLSIRSYSSPLRKTPLPERPKHTATLSSTIDASGSSSNDTNSSASSNNNNNNTVRRLIPADKKLVSHLGSSSSSSSSSDDEDDDIDVDSDELNSLTTLHAIDEHVNNMLNNGNGAHHHPHHASLHRASFQRHPYQSSSMLGGSVLRWHRPTTHNSSIFSSTLVNNNNNNNSSSGSNGSGDMTSTTATNDSSRSNSPTLAAVAPLARHHHHQHHQQQQQLTQLMHPQRKRRIKAPESLKSSLVSPPTTPSSVVETTNPTQQTRFHWRTLIGNGMRFVNVPTSASATTNVGAVVSNAGGKTQLTRRHTMIVTNNNSSNNTASDTSELSRLNHMRSSTRVLSTTSKKQQQQQQQQPTQKQVAEPNNVQFTFSELSHIRRVSTKGNLDDFLLYNPAMFDNLAHGRVCFVCRQCRFNLFNWGVKCRMCQQRVCKKCLRNAKLSKSGQLSAIPLDADSDSSCSSSSEATKLLEVCTECYKEIGGRGSCTKLTTSVDPDEYNSTASENTKTATMLQTA